MKYVPRVYQKRGIKMLLEKPHAGLFLDPGLGKTSTVLAAYKVLRARGFVKKLLVVAPRRVCLLVWPKEAAKWDDFKDLRVHFLHGKGRDLSVDADVYLINPEGLEWLFDELLDARRWPFEWLVVDESTKFKKTNTKRFKLLRNFLHRFLRRTILTGTPTPRGLLDLFGQMFVLDMGKSLGKYITHYRNEFFMQTGYGGYTWVPREGSRERILRRIAPVTLTMSAEDWLELPPLVENVVEVTLPDEAMAKYVEFEREMIAELSSGRKLVAGSAAVVSGKCRQLANGGIYVDDRPGEDGRSRRREVEELHEAKVDALEELVEELAGEPLLVAYSFEHDLMRLRRRFGAKTPAFERSLSDADALRLEREWNEGRIPLLLAQPQSTAHGLNLQDGGHNLCFYAPEWDYEISYQFIRRLLRQGQSAKRVNCHFLIARGTVDEDMLKSYRAKHRDQRTVIDLLKVGAGERLARVLKGRGARG